MKRIIVICEGQTEQSFCNDVLKPFFINKGIIIENPRIKKTGGGIVNWLALKHQITLHGKQDSTAIITTLIDYYGIYKYHNYPNFLKAETLTNKNQALDLIENGMSLDLENHLKKRFIPYIQLHELEAILFTDLTVFTNNFEEHEFSDFEYLVRSINEHPNPEMINKGLTTTPSKRLKRIFKANYAKPLIFPLLADAIGLKNIRAKCPRFNNWILKLEMI